MTTTRTPRPTTRRTIGLTALVVSASIVGVGTSASAHRRTFFGHFHETQAGKDLGYQIDGRAKMQINALGTKVRIKVTGLDPTKDYGSHLHNGTCESGGGGHYQDVEGGAVTPPNELWLTTSGTILESNPRGVARARSSANWKARTSSDTQTTARSVVVHEPGGTRIACADLD